MILRQARQRHGPLTPSWIALAVIAGLASMQASACSLVRAEIYDRTANRTLEQHRFRAQRYVAGEPGHEYSLRLRNCSDRRVLAVVSVDGINAISGETAAPDQTGYVLDAGASLEVQGWRKDYQRTAAFYFTDVADAYAARTGRPDNVGVIGVAAFRERAAPVIAAQEAAPWAPEVQKSQSPASVLRPPPLPTTRPPKAGASPPSAPTRGRSARGMAVANTRPPVAWSSTGRASGRMRSSRSAASNASSRAG